MAIASMGAEVKSPPGNGPCCFRTLSQIYHLVSQLYPNDANKHMDNFILSILLNEQQSGLKTKQTKGVWPK
jgi:hypothetical protein